MKTIRIYSDESRHKNERFLLLGGLWIKEEKVSIVEDGIKKLRKKHGYINSQGKHIDFLGEFKWTKVSDKYLSIYRELVDFFFDFIEKDIFRCCIMLVDTHDPVVIEYSNIKKEGYFKLLYQLYFHNSKIPAIYKIYPDSITNPIQDKVNFNSLHKCLNTALRNKFIPLINPEEWIMGTGVVNNITSVNSKTCEPIQLLDVVMGAMGYMQNRYFSLPNAKQAKKKLMKQVIDKQIYSGSIKYSGKKFLVARSTKFNIWIFRPKNKKSPC